MLKSFVEHKKISGSGDSFDRYTLIDSLSTINSFECLNFIKATNMVGYLWFFPIHMFQY
jgi:hypothetical protein